MILYRLYCCFAYRFAVAVAADDVVLLWSLLLLFVV